MFELLFNSWQQFPFTWSYVPGKRSPVVPIVAVMAAVGSEFAGLFALFGALFSAAWWKARSARREGQDDARLMWEDTGAGLTSLTPS
jgi:hypothetical protein